MTQNIGFGEARGPSVCISPSGKTTLKKEAKTPQREVGQK